MVQQQADQVFRAVVPSPIVLPADPRLGALAGRTIAYDAFVADASSGPRVVLSGPPLAGLAGQADRLEAATWTIDGVPVPARLADGQQTQRSWLDVADPVAAGSAIGIEVDGVPARAAVAASGVDWFADRRTLLGSSAADHPAVIADWARFHVTRHGVDAVLLYVHRSGLDSPGQDPSGQDSSERELLSTLAAIPGLEVVVTVAWPFTDDSDDGLDTAAILEHARHRFLAEAASVVWQRVDELVVTADGRSVFDHLAASTTYAIGFAGRRIADVASTVSDPPTFTDFGYTEVGAPAGPRRWAIDPRWLPDAVQWLPQTIAGIEPTADGGVLHRRFAGVRRGPSAPSVPSPIDPAVHAVDRELRAALGRPQGDRDPITGQPTDRPADRAAHPHETLARLATLIDARSRIPQGLRKIWFYRDNVLTLDYQSPEGVRYGFDIYATERGISVSLVGRDDSARHTVRKRCGGLGKLIDGNRRLELAWWRHTTPLESTAIDAVAQLQRANTLMVTPSPWVPPRSIPSYWWDHRLNFGDLIGPWIVERLSGRPTHNTIGLPNAGDALVGVGSLISSLQRPGTTIWGSGLIAPLDQRAADRLKTRKPARILAVRGRRTRDELIKHLGWDVPEVYGDPALLIDRLYTPPAESAIDAAYSVCPHYLHAREIAARVATDDAAQLIDVERDAESVVTEIATSRAVVSTSLHGLIIAQAYGVPWVWLRIDDRKLAGDAFKFEDFFTTLDREAVAAVTLTRQELATADFAAIARQARLPAGRFDAAALIDAFPYPVSQELHV